MARAAPPAWGTQMLNTSNVTWVFGHPLCMFTYDSPEHVQQHLSPHFPSLETHFRPAPQGAPCSRIQQHLHRRLDWREAFLCLHYLPTSLVWEVKESFIDTHVLKIAPVAISAQKRILFLNAAQRFGSSDLGVLF